MLLSLEHPSREHERATVYAVVQALDGTELGGRGVARADELARRDRGGTLKTYDGFAFDRSRAVAARAAV